MDAADEVVRTSGEMDTSMMPVLRAWCEEHAVGWAAQYTDSNPEPACICHGDFRLGNVGRIKGKANREVILRRVTMPSGTRCTRRSIRRMWR